MKSPHLLATFGLVAVLAAGTVAFAQTATGPSNGQSTGDGKGRHERKLHRIQMAKARIAKELNLTEKQKELIRPIREATRAKAKEIIANQSLSREQKREQIKQLREAARNDISQFLTAEQKAKIEAWKNKIQQRIKSRPTGVRPPA